MILISYLLINKFAIHFQKLMMEPQETLKFFKERLGFKTPTRVLVDGSVILDAIENKVHLRNIFQDALQDLDVELYTTKCVMQELKRYISKYSSSENMITFSELKNKLIIKWLVCLNISTI